MKKSAIFTLITLFVAAASFAWAQPEAQVASAPKAETQAVTAPAAAPAPPPPQPDLKVEPAALPAQAETAQKAVSISVAATIPATPEYKIGIDDVLDINVLQPQPLAVMVTVAPDGLITFPYIGNVTAKGLTLAQIQDEIQKRLADGYMKYPVVSVSLKESRSKKFFVYGEVNRPGTYLLDSDETVLKAISMAGGFTRFGSSSRVKVLRPKVNGSGTDVIKVNINDVMNGKNNADITLKPGDTVVVNEGMF